MPVTFSDRSTKRIEFGRRGDASDIRDDLPNEALLDSDDGREKTLQIDASELGDETLRRVEGKAAVSRDDARGNMHGQAPLSDSERNRLDFTRTTVPEARAAKASLLAEGIEDWQAYFDPSLTTSEMANLARDTQASGGARMDSADTQRSRDRQGANMFREVQSQQAKRARDGCEEGYEEACDQLVEQHGFSRQEAESLLQQQQAAQSGAGVTADGGLVDATVLRAAAHGRFLSEPPEPAPTSPGYRSDTTGRYVGYEIEEHQGKRSPETGRIKRLDAAQPIPRDEQVSRWGDPDGANGDPESGRPQQTDGAMFDALYRDKGLSESEEVTAQASAFDVSLAPDEVINGTARVGTTALGGNVLGEGERRATVFDQDDDNLIAQDLKRTRREEAAESAGVFDMGGMSDPPANDPFDITSGGGGDSSGGMFTDDRDQQASLEVGMGAGVTEDRSGKVAGSAGFKDRRDELGTGTTPDTGQQAGLFEQETNVGGDGQTDLFGGDASETTGAEYKI